MRLKMSAVEKKRERERETQAPISLFHSRRERYRFSAYYCQGKTSRSGDKYHLCFSSFPLSKQKEEEEEEKARGNWKRVKISEGAEILLTFLRKKGRRKFALCRLLYSPPSFGEKYFEADYLAR